MKYKREYINTGGFKCVYCRSKNISSFTPIFRGDYEITLSVECHDCGGKWTDIYTLNDVEEDY